MMDLNKILSNYVRGFSEEKFWRLYSKAQTYSGILKTYYQFRYMRMATKNGGYIGRETKLAGPLKLPHGFHGIHISRFASIGTGCTIFQNVTIGNSKEQAPAIGNNCVFYANSLIMGGVTIGDNVKVGAGAVVVKSCPSNSTVVGNSTFRIIENNNQ